ncbi:MAG: hypothetical protein NTX47_00800 [Candidatus Omnitrophica bacterium]|nr:hypothetical protein [Candidatus Omnitrophota bacterium]
MEKRVLLAVTLSIAVILVYPMILAKINPNLSSPIQRPQVVEKQVVVEKTMDVQTKETELVNALPSSALTENFSTDRYDLDVTNIGGSISRILVKDSKRKSDIALVTKAIRSAGILSIDGKGMLSGMSSQVFQIHNDTQTFSLENNDLKLEKRVSFLEDKYGLERAV